MGQAEIIDLLETSQMPLAARQIAEALGDRINEILTYLKKLLKHKEVKCIEINRHQALKHFGSKRKLRLFYISNLNKRDIQKAKRTLSYLQ